MKFHNDEHLSVQINGKICEWSSAGVLQSKNKNIISFVIKITKMESLLKVFLT